MGSTQIHGLHSSVRSPCLLILHHHFCSEGQGRVLRTHGHTDRHTPLGWVLGKGLLQNYHQQLPTLPLLSLALLQN